MKCYFWPFEIMMLLASLDIIDMEPYTRWLCGEKDSESFLSSLKSMEVADNACIRGTIIPG